MQIDILKSSVSLFLIQFVLTCAQATCVDRGVGHTPFFSRNRTYLLGMFSEAYVAENEVDSAIALLQTHLADPSFFNSPDLIALHATILCIKLVQMSDKVASFLNRTDKSHHIKHMPTHSLCLSAGARNDVVDATDSIHTFSPPLPSIGDVAMDPLSFTRILRFLSAKKTWRAGDRQKRNRQSFNRRGTAGKKQNSSAADWATVNSPFSISLPLGVTEEGCRKALRAAKSALASAVAKGLADRVHLHCLYVTFLDADGQHLKVRVPICLFLLINAMCCLLMFRSLL